eukprot:4430555-Amphidinium_carterae.1
MTIEIFVQAQNKYDLMNPPTHNRLFLFVLQHYRDRLQYIFQRAGASIEDYNQAVEYFDKRGGAHFSRPNGRDLHEIRATQTAEERERALQYIRELPEMQPRHKTPSIAEKVSENYETRSTYGHYHAQPDDPPLWNTAEYDYVTKDTAIE